VTTNPHNQSVTVAIRLGILGVIVLCAMWLSHAMLFWSAGKEAWIGTRLIIQNVISSLFNSYVFDFTQGWIYVFGVGIIGGVVLQRNEDKNKRRI
jgi:O-antigen ligase